MDSLSKSYHGHIKQDVQYSPLSPWANSAETNTWSRQTAARSLATAYIIRQFHLPQNIKISLCMFTHS